MKLRLVAALAVVVAGRTFAAEPPSAPPPPPKSGQLISLLQEISEDYAESVEEGEEEDGFDALVDDALATAKSLPNGERYVKDVTALKAQIEAHAQPRLINESTKRLISELVLTEKLAQAPASAPDLDHAAKLFNTQCATCHGADGSAKTPVAATLHPAPANLRSRERMGGISPYRVYNALSYGIPRTAMPAFTQLSEEERWALAFYAFTLRHPECRTPAPKLPLEKLSTSTDRQLSTELGELSLPCARRLVFKK